MSSENINDTNDDWSFESIWNIDEDILFDMNQYERDKIFDLRMRKLYEAIVALSAGSTPQEVMRILHSEEQ
jgi:hypothetical protein